jgi:hypothetical protein
MHRPRHHPDLPPGAAWRRRRPHRRPPRGVATLLVVMALFFLVSMVAAYTSRSLIFEQRTSANQYRATIAFEAAEGGIEWALARLNGGRVNAACQPSTSAADGSFRSRYLRVDEGGAVGAVVFNSPAAFIRLRPACSLVGRAWQCSCPSNSDPVLPAGDGSSIQPTFSVQIERAPGAVTPGIFLVQSTACTSATPNCLARAEVSGGDAVARMSITAALLPAIASTPAAALTVRGSVEVSSPTTVINEDSTTNGLAVHASGPIRQSANFTTVSVPGAPADLSGLVPDDASLDGGSADRYFLRFFGVSREVFRRQPVVANFGPCNNGCGDELRRFIQANPGRPVYVAGDLVLDSAGDLGSAAEPVLLVVERTVRWDSAGIQVTGLVYARGASASAPGAGWLQGALISEADINAAALPNLRYDAAVIQRIRTQQGSVVRLPGGWRDF